MKSPGRAVEIMQPTNPVAELAARVASAQVSFDQDAANVEVNARQKVAS
jgi:hypothetical protein